MPFVTLTVRKPKSTEFKDKVSADMPDYFPWWDEREYK